MPIGAMRSAGKSLFTLVRRVREELGANTVCGASNISFGLPDRPTLNATFLAMAISAGMTCAITNPLEEYVRKTVLAANVFMGVDENCIAWLAAQRASAQGQEGQGSASRRQRRIQRG
jgi:5-methyltetrahydrofolate--homocysteine methyltransferase